METIIQARCTLQHIDDLLMTQMSSEICYSYNFIVGQGLLYNIHSAGCAILIKKLPV